LPVYIKDLVVDNIAIKRIQVMDPENMIINIEDTNGQIYNWDTLPETVKIKIYNHLSFNRILR
jgi:alpha-N-acetylglucosamine transferase